MASAEGLVLIVDDDAKFRALARTLLERVAALRVNEAGDGNEALAAAAQRPPQLVLLDVRLPGTSGYEVFRELRDRCGEDLPIIFVSGERTDPYDRIVGLLLGADDYLFKPFDPDELIARVRRSLARRANGVAAPVETDAPITELTLREREVLALLAAGGSSKQIARRLVISPRTVQTHIQHILGKLGVHARTQAIAVAHQAGLVLPPDTEAHVLSAVAEPRSGSSRGANLARGRGEGRQRGADRAGS